MFNSVKHHRRKLTLQQLEDRALLTAFLVNTLADDPVATASDTDGLISLREAIRAASDDSEFGDAPAGQGGGVVDTITFHPSLANQTVVLGGEQLTVSGDLSLTGLGASSLTISGNDGSRIFSVDSGVSAGISHLTIARGIAPNGGGIYNAGTLVVSHATFTDNSADNGGAIALRSAGMLTVDNSVFSGNTASSTGGAIDSFGGFSGPYGTLEIANSTFSENSAGSGAAVWTDGGADIASSVLSGNSARLWGGGIANSRNTLTVTGSTFSDNESGFYGGAIDNSSRGTVKIADSTLSGNSTGREGGAIENFGGTLELANSTLSGNSSMVHGGGVWSVGVLESTNTTFALNRADADGDGSGAGGALYLASSSRFPTPVLNNMLVAGNLRGVAGGDVPDDLFGTLDVASSYNLVADAATSGGLTDGVNGNIVGDGGTGTIDVTTVLDTNLADNEGPTLTHALVPGSPAVDTGDNSKAVDEEGNLLPFDQRGEGFNRIVNGEVDIGAFEVQPPPQPVQIDVKPGSDPNSINLASQGLVAIAIFTTDDFDADDVNVSSVVWAGTNVAQKNDGSFFSALEDVDGDGDLDLVLHFRPVATDLLAIYEDLLREDLADGTLDSYRQAVDIALEGLTNDGSSFRGSDSVDLFLKGKNLKDLRNQRGIQER